MFPQNISSYLSLFHSLSLSVSVSFLYLVMFYFLICCAIKRATCIHKLTFYSAITVIMSCHINHCSKTHASREVRGANTRFKGGKGRIIRKQWEKLKMKVSCSRIHIYLGHTENFDCKENLRSTSIYFPIIYISLILIHSFTYSNTDKFPLSSPKLTCTVPLGIFSAHLLYTRFLSEQPLQIYI